jgi:hypothetical protein
MTTCKYVPIYLALLLVCSFGCNKGPEDEKKPPVTAEAAKPRVLATFDIAEDQLKTERGFKPQSTSAEVEIQTRLEGCYPVDLVGVLGKGIDGRAWYPEFAGEVKVMRGDLVVASTRGFAPTKATTEKLDVVIMPEVRIRVTYNPLDVSLKFVPGDLGEHRIVIRSDKGFGVYKVRVLQ